jgi:hypothetical protein
LGGGATASTQVVASAAPAARSGNGGTSGAMISSACSVADTATQNHVKTRVTSRMGSHMRVQKSSTAGEPRFQPRISFALVRLQKKRNASKHSSRGNRTFIRGEVVG